MGCGAGLTLCNASACVDLSNDPENCGGCGFRCTGSLLISSVGSCKEGKCTQACAPGWTSCDGKCDHLPSSAANCGSCGHACEASQFCLEGVCHAESERLLASGLSNGGDLAADGAEVFVAALGASTNEGGIYKVSASGSALVPLATGQGVPRRLAVDGTHVYWVNEAGSTVMRARRDGSATAELVTRMDRPRAIALDVDAYVLDAPDGHSRYVKRAPKGAGVASALLVDIYDQADEITVFDRVLYAVRVGPSVVEAALYEYPLPAGPLRFPSWVGSYPNAFAIDQHHAFVAVQTLSSSPRALRPVAQPDRRPVRGWRLRPAHLPARGHPLRGDGLGRRAEVRPLLPAPTGFDSAPRPGVITMAVSASGATPHGLRRGVRVLDRRQRRLPRAAADSSLSPPPGPLRGRPQV